MYSKEQALNAISENIANHGHHLYLVSGGLDPRFAYSIGAGIDGGTEVILAGALFYDGEEVLKITEAAISLLRQEPGCKQLDLGPHGTFFFRNVAASWSSKLLLGALDYFKVSSVNAVQIVPDSHHITIDVPDLSREWDPVVEPVWQWLDRPWKYGVPEQSIAITNLDALRGEPITECVRWENDEWELFAGAGPDVEKSEMRAVPLGTLLAADPSLEIVTTLEIGGGVWREDRGTEWNVWKRKSSSGG